MSETMNGTTVRRITNATRRLAKAEATVAQLRAERDDAIRQAVAGGATLRAVAAIADVTHNAVAKIVRQDPEPAAGAADGR